MLREIQPKIIRRFVNENLEGTVYSVYETGHHCLPNNIIIVTEDAYGHFDSSDPLTKKEVEEKFNIVL